MSWRSAKCLVTLRNEINDLFPRRDKSSDGAIGDQSHQSRASDHNPDANGVVRAQDIDEDLDPNNPHAMEAIVQFIVGLGAHGDTRLNPSGYVIYERRIWSAAHRWQERPYDGPNAHDHHAHISCGSDPVGYDRVDPWGIASIFAPPPPPLPPTTEQEDDDMIRIYDLTFDNDPVQYARIGNVIAPITGQQKAELLEVKPKAVVEETVYGPEAWAAIVNLCTMKA